MTRATVTRTRGDDWAIPLQLASRGVAVNLAGATVRAQLRLGSPSATDAVDLAVDVHDAAEGVVVLRLDAATTRGLRPATWSWDVEVTDSGGLTLTYGVGSQLIVTPDTTRQVVP